MCESNKDAQGLAEDVVWYSRNKQIRVESGVQNIVMLTGMNVSDYDFEWLIIRSYCIIW